jgi:hypothetical protein
MSLYDVSRDYARQFSFNQLGYPAQRQALGNSQAVVTRWVVQAKNTLLQNLQQRQIATNVNSGTRNLITPSYGIGPGLGMVFPKSAPGTTITALPIGTEVFNLGASNISPTGNSVYTYSRSQAYLGVSLPSGLTTNVKHAGGYSYTSGISSQASFDWTEFSYLNIIPGASTTVDPLTSSNYQSIPHIASTVSSTSVYSTAQLDSVSSQLISLAKIATNNKAYLKAQEVVVGAIDPVDKREAEAAIIGTEEEVRARSKQFKLEALRSLADLASLALASEVGASAAYPALYALANSAWLDKTNVEIFKQIAAIEANPTFKQIAGLVSTVNKYLPQAQSIYNFLFPSSGPKLVTQGASIDLGTLTIKPNYQPQLDRINNFLPVAHRLTLNAEQTELKLGAFVCALGSIFPFDLKFRNYIDATNKYLPSDFKFKYGIEDRIILVTPGIVISQAQGLLIADKALEVGKLLTANLKCGNYAEPEIVVAASNFTSSSNTTVVKDSVRILRTTLLSTLGGTFDWDASPPKPNVRGIANLAEKFLNTALPDNLPIKLGTDSNGLSSIGLGLLQARRTSATTWEFSLPTVNDLNSGIEVIASLSPTPPDLTFIRESLGQLTSFYQEHRKEFINFFGGQDVVGNLLRLPKSKIKLDLSTGIRLEGKFGKPEEDFADLGDIATTTISGGYLDAQAVANFTQRPTFAGSLLPLLSWLDSALERNASNGSLGRSDAGLSLVTGKIVTNNGTNYSLLASLCLDVGTLIPTGELDPLGDTDSTGSTGLDNVVDNPAEPLAAEPTGTLDPQSTRDLLEAQLIQLGLAERAENLIDSLDTFLYPPVFEFDDDDNVVEVVDDRDRSERELDPIAIDLTPSFGDFLNVVEALSDLPAQQLLGGLTVSGGLETATAPVARATAIRYRERLDCQSLTYYQSALQTTATTEDFPTYATSYGIQARPFQEYVDNPIAVVDLLDNVEPRLRPAIERLLIGDLVGFFRQAIWAKAGVDIYYMPRQYLMLQTNVRGYYGGAVPSSNPTRDWQDELTW